LLTLVRLKTCVSPARLFSLTLCCIHPASCGIVAHGLERQWVAWYSLHFVYTCALTADGQQVLCEDTFLYAKTSKTFFLTTCEACNSLKNNTLSRKMQHPEGMPPCSCSGQARPRAGMTHQARHTQGSRRQCWSWGRACQCR
jgi:hypothetical protein